MDKLIAKGKEKRNKSFNHLRTEGEFLPISRSALGKGYLDEDEEDSDVDEENV